MSPGAASYPAAPRQARIRVPASSANIGPGYDSFGLALGKYDDVLVRRLDHDGLEITVEGEGAGSVPRDEGHLVYRAARRAFAAMGEPVPGLELRCTNAIPHAGGQGSSAAAAVAGILAARAVTDGGRERLSDDGVFALATEMEGHPDNVAPALVGGFTVSWLRGGSPAVPRLISVAPHPGIRVLLLTADDACATTVARAALPATVPHVDAAVNSARAALMVPALTADPALLFDATADRLHQPYRAEVMPRTARLLAALRAGGHAAVLSGAGPAMLVLGTELPDLSSFDTAGFTADIMTVPSIGATVDGDAAWVGDRREHAAAPGMLRAAVMQR